MKVGVVGAEASKFTALGEARARAIIREILSDPQVEVAISGHCHLGGVDIWLEEEAKKLGMTPKVYPPAVKGWWSGYRPRNLKIARASDVVHVIVVKQLPVGFRGRRFDHCYHCQKSDHVKSGGCWTARQAMLMGKTGIWHIVDNYAQPTALRWEVVT